MTQLYTKRIRVGDKEVWVQGDKDYVENEFKKLKEEVFSRLDAATLKEPAKKVSLREFFESTSPTRLQDNLAVIGYYLEKIQGVANFSKKILVDEASTYKILLGKNIGRDVKQLIQKGIFEPIGSEGGVEIFRLTLKGENFIEEMKKRG